MAKMQIKMPDKFLKQITTLGEQIDTVMSDALEAGGKVVLDAVRGNLQSSINSGTKEESRSTGQLASALGMSPVMLDKNDNHNIKIGFAEPRSDGKSNAMIANILENGKPEQPPRPFLAPAKSSSRGPAIAAMKAKLTEVIK